MQFTKSFALLAVMVAVASAQVAVPVNPATDLPVTISIIASPTNTVSVVKGASSTVSVSAGPSTTVSVDENSSTTVSVSANPTTTATSGTGTTTASTGSATSTSTAGETTTANGASLVKVHHRYASITSYCRLWRSNCENYRPNDKRLEFYGTSCTPGDYQGRFPHHVATANCEFTDGTQLRSINHHIASQTGAYIY